MLPTGPFSVILIDPPWTFATRSAKGKGKSPEQHYQCMSLADIKALPIGDIAAKDCVLFLWVTDPMLEKGFDLLRAWGFTYKTVGFYWTKLTKKGKPFVGCGYYTRANPEQCWIATRGHPKRLSKSVRRLIQSQRREHSRKPDEVHESIERLFAGPYCELFGRQQRPGWTVWGNEADKFRTLDVAA